MEYVYIKNLSMKINHCIRKDMTHKSKVTLSSSYYMWQCFCKAIQHFIDSPMSAMAAKLFSDLNSGVVELDMKNLLWFAMCNRNVWKYFHLSLIRSPIVHFNFNNNNDSYFIFFSSPNKRFTLPSATWFEMWHFHLPENEW